MVPLMVTLMMGDMMSSASRNTRTSGGGALSELAFAIVGLPSVDTLSLGGSVNVGVDHASGGRSLTILLTSSWVQRSGAGTHGSVASGTSRSGAGISNYERNKGNEVEYLQYRKYYSPVLPSAFVPVPRSLGSGLSWSYIVGVV